MREQLADGVGFLADQQLADGSFLSYSSPSWREFHMEKTYRAVFPVALMLDCLSEFEDGQKLALIKRKLADWLLGQKSEYWSFNYWARDVAEAKSKPYPDDLDDTFCSLAALTRYDRALIDGAAMAKIVMLLTAVEEAEGGPYRTWLVPETAEEVWRDVDLAVNNNVAYLLSLHEVDLPKLVALVETAIEKAEYQSQYYPAVYPILYFISRWYRGAKGKQLRHYVLKKRYAAGNWGNALNTALAVSTLLNLEVASGEVKRSINYLRKMQNKNGSWPAAAFCLDPALGGKPYYAGSAALTTAFCLEAMAKFEHSSKATTTKASTGKALDSKELRVARGGSEMQAEKIVGQVEVIVRKRLGRLDDELRREALDRLEKQLAADKDQQIRLLPYLFREALGEKGRAVPDGLVTQLGAASVYGWVAYTIYDDFLDEEGKVARLPVANVCLRELATLFLSAVPEQAGWPYFFHQVMDRLEAANVWEVRHCRANISTDDGLRSLLNTPDLWPDYGDMQRLAERSLGHALGPAAILFSLGFDQYAVEVKQLMSFFKHYLIARQLNDDAHDWEADLRRGHINAVGAMLLRCWPKAGGRRGAPAGWQRWRELFWHEVVTQVCEEVLQQISEARQILVRHQLIERPSELERLLAPVERSAREALTKREQTLEFLKTYQSAKA